jgi:F-type H+-transporting ATPase subunit b
MLIDWFTVGAQVLNFAILVWLMKRFLYKPILDAIDAREKRIENELAAAGRKQSEAERLSAEFRRKNDEIDQQRDALLDRAQADADAERKRLLDAARQAADVLAEKRREALTSETRRLMKDLRQRTQAEVFAITRKTLADVADVDLEARACRVFLARLKSLEGRPREALAAALSGAGDAVVVHSAFELSAAQRADIRQAIVDSFGLQLDVHYATEPDLVGGIELLAQGQRFAWTISDYLASLERGVNELLQVQIEVGDADAEPASAVAPDGAVGKRSTPDSESRTVTGAS